MSGLVHHLSLSDSSLVTHNASLTTAIACHRRCQTCQSPAQMMAAKWMADAQYGHYKTQSEHPVSLNLKTKFLKFIAFPQFVNMERFSNRV
jgi:hypothetical protein